MTATALERIEAQLLEIRELVDRAGTQKRELYPLKEAAQLLGVGLTKLRELVDSQVLAVVPLGGRPMVPASEIHRISHVAPRRLVSPQVTRLAASLAKLREPIPGAKAMATHMQKLTKKPGQTQDSAALRTSAKKR